MTETSNPPAKGFILAPKLYDKVKFIVQVLLPAFGTLYFTLGNIWSWPNIEQVLGSTTAIGLFLGAIVGISSASYNASNARFDGAMTYEFDESGKATYLLEVEGDPSDLHYKDQIVFKVKPSDFPER